MGTIIGVSLSRDKRNPRLPQTSCGLRDLALILLIKTDLAGNPGKEGSIFLAELAPGAAVGKRYHPGDAFAYIVEGSMPLEVAGKPTVALKPGDTGHVPPKQVHDDKNASQSAPLKFLVFHVAEQGQPLAVPAQ
jgi:quercetin dioxygenase-like cupin family protein